MRYIIFLKNGWLKAIAFLIFTLIIPVDLLAQMQNPYWTLPANYVNINSGTVSALPSTAISKTISANGIYNAAGNLNFYLSGNNQVKDRNGNVLTLSGYFFSFDSPIIPKPGTCNSFYVATASPPPGTVCESSYLYNLDEISFNATTGTISYVNTISIAFESEGMYAGIAVSPMKVVGAEEQIDVYVVSSGCDASTEAPFGEIIRITLDNSGIVSKTTLYTTNLWVDFRTTEADLSYDGNLLAWGSMEFGGISTLYVYNIGTGSLDSESIVTNRISGVEFSPSGDRLFFSKEGSGISYVTLSSSGVIGSQSTVSGSSGLGDSHIEYGSDDYMYASNGSVLKKFNPYEATPTISGTTVTVSNPSNSIGIYTLIDQIDGGNYLKLFKAYGCTVSKIFNNTSASSSTVSEFIRTVNSVSVTSGTNITFTAGGEITLDPGFSATADATTVFAATISPCPTADIDPSCAMRQGFLPFETDDGSSKDKIGISPNPSTGTFLLELKLPLGKIKDVGLFDASGKGVKNLIPSEIIEVNLESIPAGIYFIKVTTDEREFNEKVIIAR